MTAVDARVAAAVSAAKVAALTLWLPTLVPIVTGMLRDSRDAFHTYLLSLPLVPGLIVPTLLRLDDVWFFVVGGITTLLAYAGTWQGLHRLRGPWRITLQVAVVLAVTFASIGFANAVRA